MKQETIYDCNYFIAKFSAIPESKWTIGTQRDDIGRCCAYGHINSGVGGREEFTKLMRFLPAAYSSSGDIDTGAQINNGNHLNYQQPTPKQRILAALYDIKKLQEPKEQPPTQSYTNISKELAVLPCDEMSDKVSIPHTLKEI